MKVNKTQKIIFMFLIITTYLNAGIDTNAEIELFEKKYEKSQLMLLNADYKSIMVCEELKKEGEILFSKIKEDDIDNKKSLASSLERLYHRETNALNLFNACSPNLIKAFYYKKFNMSAIDFAILYVQGDFYQNIDYDKAFKYIKEEESKNTFSFCIYNGQSWNKELILGQFYEFGIGTNKDISKAISYYETSFEKSTKSSGAWQYSGLRLASYYAKNNKVKASEILNKILVSSFGNILFMKEKDKLTEYAKYIPELKDYPVTEYLKEDYSGKVVIDLPTVVKIYKIKYNLL